MECIYCKSNNTRVFDFKSKWTKAGGDIWRQDRTVKTNYYCDDCNKPFQGKYYQPKGLEAIKVEFDFTEWTIHPESIKKSSNGKSCSFEIFQAGWITYKCVAFNQVAFEIMDGEMEEFIKIGEFRFDKYNTLKVYFN